MFNQGSALLVLLAAVLWGTTGTVQTFAPQGASPISIGASRLAVGGGALFLLMIAAAKLQLKDWPIRPTILASLSMAFYQPLFFSAVSMTGVAVGTVVAIESAPILAGLLEWIVQKRKLSRLWIFSTMLSVTGCSLLFSNRDSVIIEPVGVLLALGAGLSFAGYTLVSKQLISNRSSLSVTAVVFSLSALCLSPFLFLSDMTWIFKASGIAVSLHLGLAATGAAYLLFAKGLMNVSSSTAVTLSLAEPLTAALLGVLLVGETLSTYSWAGLVLILTAICLLICSTNRQDQGKVTSKN
ncbi:EamA family transporter [Rossellomorea vietnamensis]|uniref:EamA family transporter n=1 Tax=Rossellomorea vietnamensis TaxID=218284 RepID=A0A5D4NQI0_9BACI|nr:EamA family transporter [Rossellomorea vietnamensis]TYS16169.1 EamA family transporter [Rossellomorea vietnamensis]